MLSYDQVADWLFHLRDQRKLASSSVNIAVSAARFLDRTTLGRDTAELLAKVPRLKRETKRAHGLLGRGSRSHSQGCAPST